MRFLAWLKEEQPVTEEFGRRMPEYEESRANAGLTMERVFLQKNPDGGHLMVIYGEANGSFSDVQRASPSSC